VTLNCLNKSEQRLQTQTKMGGGVAKENRATKYQFTDTPASTPIPPLNQDKFQKLRMIFHNPFAKAAYINFLRHEESPVPNYFRGMNFIKIGDNAEVAESTLAGSKKEEDILLRFPTIAPYFDNTTNIMRQEYFARVGDCESFLRELENVSNYLLLLMAIESIDRFEKSKSHQAWFATEHSVEHSTREKSLFSYHSTRRTKVLTNTDYDMLKPIMSSRDWLFVLKACLENTPIATAICRFETNGKCLVVDCNEAYQKMFCKTAHELYGKKLNLLRSPKEQEKLLQHCIDLRLSSKLVLNVKVEKHVLSIAVASIPIMDLQGACKYMVFVCCNMSTKSFNIKELKITSDFADILPRYIHMRSEAQQKLLFPKPAKSSKPVYDDSNVYDSDALTDLIFETGSACSDLSDGYVRTQTHSLTSTIRCMLGADDM
jgi:hypothetical protein